MAKVDFSEAGQERAECWRKNGRPNNVSQLQRKADETYEVDLKKKRQQRQYTKVIVEPLVRVEGCDYIVAGVVEFHINDKDGGLLWVATFDYGNGTCDPYIGKTTKDGASTFSMNDYPDWN